MHRARSACAWAAFLAVPAWALPVDPKAQLGTYADGSLILAAHLAEGRKDFRGAIFDQGANLRDACLEGADLGGADLAEADLTGANLARAGLEGADLRGAVLTGVRLAEARLRDADLRQAQVDPRALEAAHLEATLLPDGTRKAAPHQAEPEPQAGAKAAEQTWAGLEADPGQAPARYEASAPPAVAGDALQVDSDVSRADLRGFFLRGRPVGTVAQVGLPDTCEGIRKLVPLPDGLAWFMAGGSRLCLLRKEGYRSFQVGAPIADLGLDAGRLWFTCADGSVKRVGVDALRRRAAKIGALADGVHLEGDFLDQIRMNTLVMHKERIWVLCDQPRALVGYALPDAGARGLLATRALVRPLDQLEDPVLDLQPGPHGDLLFRTAGGMGYLDVVACLRQRGGSLFYLPTALKPDECLVDRARRIWLRVAGGACLVSRAAGGGEMFLRGPFTKPRLRVGGIAEGPAGSLWFTEPGNDSLCQVLPGGQVRRFRLPQPGGLEPTLLANGGNGLMYFTMAGGRRLGAIVANADGLDLPPARTAVPAAAEARPGKARQRREARKAASRARRKDLVAGEPVATRPETPEGPGEAAPEAAPKAVPAPVPPPPAAQATAEAWLRDRGIRVDLAHIERRHFWSAGAGEDEPELYAPGRFTRGHSTWQRLEGLVAVALAYQDDHLEWNADGSKSVFHQFAAPVGFYLDRPTGGWVPTRLLRVVLDGQGRDVRTAFPVKPFGRFREVPSPGSGR